MTLEKVLAPLLDDSDDGRARRIDFYKQPMAYLDANAPDLEQKYRAILFSMDRKQIADHAPKKAGAVDLHLFSGHWPAQGEDWPAPPSGKFRPPIDRRATAQTDYGTGVQAQPTGDAELVALAGGGGGGGGSAWGDPGPHGRGFRPASGKTGSALTITLVGEGFLDVAKIVFEHVDQSANNGGPFEAEQTESAYMNFRRCYLRCNLKIGKDWTPGAYTVTIQNDPDNSDTYIKAGHFFHVKK